jgi:hypothetical protein
MDEMITVNVKASECRSYEDALEAAMGVMKDGYTIRKVARLSELFRMEHEKVRVRERRVSEVEGIKRNIKELRDQVENLLEEAKQPEFMC